MKRWATTLCALCGVVSWCFVVIACSTQPEPTVTELPDAIRAELRAQIRDDEAELAIQRISALRREQVLPGEELDLYLADAVDNLVERYEEAIAGGRIDESLRLLRNLRVLGQDVSGLADPVDLYVQEATALYEEGNLPAALAVLLRTPELSGVPADVLEQAVLVARELNNRFAAGIIGEVLGPAWRAAHPEYDEFVSSVPSPVDMVQGTVTVWVNRGLRLEGGVGIPDRVIGSGFFIDPRGYIVTNHHVIASEVDPEYEGYSRLYVRPHARPEERIPARVIGYDRTFDIALLKAEIDAPYVFSFADVRGLEPGSRIIAIGSPGGLENTITSGIISAVGRRFLQMGDAIQVDVPINPGSSGGPLLDESGNLIALVFAGIEQFEGVNFAIPSYWIQKFLPALYNEGPVVHPWLGVAVERVSEGLEVSYVAKDSPVESVGLQIGDILLSLDGWEAERIGSIQSVLLNFGPGSLVPISWSRDGEVISGMVALQQRPSVPADVALSRDVHHRLYPVLYGMSVEQVGGIRFRQEYRVTRVYPGSIADETGITEGDTFTERGFEIDDEADVAYLEIFIRKRTEGFMQTGIQLPAYLEVDNFL
jgi:serine protease Do